MGDKIRLGIIGIGNMGRGHIGNIQSGRCPSVELVSLCDAVPAAMEKYPQYKHVADRDAFLKDPGIDAVLIATPHYDHTTLGIAALQAGKHVMVEKPISVHKADCERLIAAYEQRPDRKQVFGAMFNVRTDAAFRKLRQLIKGGELGEIRRINWIVTNWFRSEAYYASGGWRATWKGEGGGVLLNQCPHNLDLLWWLFGTPAKIRAFCRFGHYHGIEVEDDVTAYLEYPNGANAVFVATTGEAPGTNRLEIAAERGRVILEGGQLRFDRNEVETTEHSRTTKSSFGTPACWRCEIPVGANGGGHAEVLENFAQAALGKAELIAPAVEGIHSVELANAMIHSTWTDSTVQMPLDGAAYAKLLAKACANSRADQKEAEAKKSKGADADDFSKSFAKA